MSPIKHLKVIEFGCHDAHYNMALDSHLFACCDRDPQDVFLRFYTWCPPALSLGYFDRPDAIDFARAELDGVQVVKRPTGGRVVLHKDDLTYTIVLPREPAATVSGIYAVVSQCIVDGLVSLGATVEIARGALERSASRSRPCFLSATRHEITHAGRKVVGSAQRMGRNAVLQHGSIPVGPGYLGVVNYLRCGEAEREDLAREMRAGTACIEGILGAKIEPQTLAAALLEAFATRFGGVVSRIPHEALGGWMGPHVPGPSNHEVKRRVGP